MKTIHKRDFVLGVAVFALALLVLFGILPWAVKTPEVIPNLALSPTFWPRIILVSVAGLGVLLAVRALRDQFNERHPDESESGTSPVDHSDPRADVAPFDLSDFRVMLAALLMVLFCVLLKPLGVVVPAVALLFGLVLMHERQQWPKAIGVAAATVLTLYLFFRYVAQVPIPLGPLNGLL